MHELLLDVRRALAIWLGLVALMGIVSVVLSQTSRRGRERRAARRAARVRHAELREQLRAMRAAAAARGGGTDPVAVGATGADGLYASANAGAAGDAPPADAVAELRRYAEEVAGPPAGRAVTAERRRQEWRAVLNAQEAAWRAYEAADQAARRSLRASVFPLPESPLTEEEIKRRERYLLRAATGAYRRGELTIDQLSAAMMHRGGWDPRRHPFDQDLLLRFAGRSRLLRTYHAVSEIERTAWHEAQMAAIAQRSLNEEAFAAAMRAHLAQHPLPARPPRQASPAPVSPRPVRTQQIARGRATVRLSRGVAS